MSIIKNCSQWGENINMKKMTKYEKMVRIISSSKTDNILVPKKSNITQRPVFPFRYTGCGIKGGYRYDQHF